MATSLDAIALCPINFKRFNAIKDEVGGIEATLLYSKLSFHQRHTKIVRNGLDCITRSREELGKWFDFGCRKIDRLLKALEIKNLLRKESGLWYGKKQLFFNVVSPEKGVPINVTLLQDITEITGSLENALTFSYIAFLFNNTQIVHENKKWAALKKESLADWLNVSIRKTDNILSSLEEQGFILKKNFVFKDKRQSHFHITEKALNHDKFVLKQNIDLSCSGKQPSTETNQIQPNDTISRDYHLSQKISNEIKQPYSQKSAQPESANISAQENVVHALLSPEHPVDNHLLASTQSYQICREQPADLVTSIKVRTKGKEMNNIHKDNGKVKQQKIEQKNTEHPCDIIFNTIGEELTYRQQRYLQSAIQNTIKRNALKISSPKALEGEVTFAILTPEQRKGVTGFRHAVSRFMKILGCGRWRTPIGFYNHSEQGRAIKANNLAQETQWEKQKQAECQHAEVQYNLLKSQILTTQPHDEYTNEACDLAHQIVRLSAGETTMQANDPRIGIINRLTTKMLTLIKRGADRERVSAILRIEW